MIKKICLGIFLIVLIPVTLFAQLDKAIQNYANDSVFMHAGISICIRDMESGKILAGYNENMSLTSASVMKLVSTGTALDILGPDHKFYTKVGYVSTIDKTDKSEKIYVIIKGLGDPALGSEYFPEHYGDFIDEWARSIVKEGIKHVTGCVIADASVFSYHPIASGWNWGDLGNYYGAGVHGLSAYDNMYRISFNTRSEGSSPEITNLEPYIPGLEIDNQLKASGNRDRGYVYLEPYGSNAIIRGTIPIERDTFELKASIPDPPLLLAIKLHKRLEEIGVTIDEPPTTLRKFQGELERLGQGSEGTITSESVSPGLSEIISVTNLESVNMFAENLVWSLAYSSKGNKGVYLAEGLEIIKDHLKMKGVNTSGLYMTDGSGLSRSNAISSSFLTDYLVYMGAGAKYSDTFRNSLAIPGKGTLEPYFLAPELIDNLRAKSGTVTRARNYAGYLMTSSGREIAFGILSNNFDCSSSEVTKRVEELLIEVYKTY